MIGIIGAMQLETQTICEKMTDVKTETVSGTEYVVGKLWGKDAVVATCGPGKVFAALAAQTMILRYNVQCVVNVGVAGTLSPDLHIGDLAIATATVQHDMDTSGLGDPVGLVSKINVTYFRCDLGLIKACQQAAEKAKLRYLKGVIATGDQFISAQAKKSAIVEQFDAIACEMEGGAIGHTCYVNGVPYLVIRAISDEADGSADVDFFQFATHSAQNTVAILREMVPNIG